jgi:hypothetical protein
MVSPKPNETRIEGTVRELRPNERRPGYMELVVAVDRADDIEGRANLLADTPGQELAVTTNAKDVEELGLQPGERVVVGAELRAPGAVWSRPNSVRRGD